MPLVISQETHRKSIVQSEEVLAEILGHRDFDGEDWACGDLILFEDGTEAHIVSDATGQFHVWSEPQSSDLCRAIAAINRGNPGQPLTANDFPDWHALFTHLRREKMIRARGCASLLLWTTVVGLFLTGGPSHYFGIGV